MVSLQLVAQVIIALGILNVWLIRFNWATGYRGGNAKNMKEEFAVYGLPPAFMYVIGAAKVALALALLAGIWLPSLVQPAAVGMAVLMAGALAMHIKVKDPVKKSAPAFCVFALSVFVAFA